MGSKSWAGCEFRWDQPDPRCLDSRSPSYWSQVVVFDGSPREAAGGGAPVAPGSITTTRSLPGRSPYSHREEKENAVLPHLSLYSSQKRTQSPKGGGSFRKMTPLTYLSYSQLDAYARLCYSQFRRTGQVGEWLKPTDCKSVPPCEVRRFESFPVHHLSSSWAVVAQLVERVLGKDEVTSSILVNGSSSC
jgi:hypothetical protein